MGVIEKLNLQELSALSRKANESLMVSFINNDVLARAGLDVRKSIALYDSEKMFKYAVTPAVFEGLTDEQKQELAEHGVRYYSTGV